MLPHLLLLFALAAIPREPLTAALDSFSHVATYSVTIRSTSGDSSQLIRYYFKRPGFVRMEFVRPHNGAVLVYSPITGKARLRPFAFLKPLVLTLSPDNGLITSPQGHHVDASDPGSLLKTVKSLAERGETRMMGNDDVGGQESALVEVTGESGVTVAGGIHRYLLWLDVRTLLPLKTKSYDLMGEMVEEVSMDDPKIDVDIPDSFFDL